MSESGIRPGAFVRHDKFGVGKVLAVDGNPSVLFWTNRESGKREPMPNVFLDPLLDDSPEAMLWESPGKLVSWAEEAPLGLVAAALSIDGGSGKAADIQAKLDGRVISDGNWGSWWRRVQPKLKRTQEFFRIDKLGKDNVYTLLSSVDDVLVDTPKPIKTPVKESDSLVEWQDWLLSGWDKEPPEVYPKKAVSDTLAKWHEDSIQQVLSRTLWGAKQYLYGGRKPSVQPAYGWLEAVGRASRRWWECTAPYSDRNLAAQSSEALLALAEVTGYAKAIEWLLWAHALSGQTDESWRQGFAAGMWTAIGASGSDAHRDRRNLFRATSELLGRQSRADLAREIALAAFGADTEPNYSELDELDRILEELASGEETQRLFELIALSSDASPQDKDKLLNYVLNSRNATSPERLNLLVLATLLLTDGRGAFAAQASKELDIALATSDIAAALNLYHATHSRITREIDEQRRAHAAKLERERREQERLRQQVRDLDAELRAKREASKLEIRRDMLLAVGEVLQWVTRYEGSVDKLAEGVEAGLRIALRAGEADLLDTAPEGKVLAPGVVVRDETHGDLVLLKALVKNEAI